IPGSLRAAILAANATVGVAETITFNIPTTDSGYNSSTRIFVIQPTAALPPITDPVILDGTTEPGFAGKPIIHLNGSSAGAGGVAGLTISAGGSVVRGLIINRFSGDGIDLTTNGGNVIRGNYIGTAVGGLSAAANGGVGILIASPNNTIGGGTAAARNL